MREVCGTQNVRRDEEGGAAHVRGEMGMHGLPRMG